MVDTGQACRAANGFGQPADILMLALGCRDHGDHLDLCPRPDPRLSPRFAGSASIAIWFDRGTGMDVAAVGDLASIEVASDVHMPFGDGLGLYGTALAPSTLRTLYFILPYPLFSRRWPLLNHC